MANEPEKFDENWGEHTAHKTFVWTLVSAALFAGAVFVFILLANP